jgi:hypothetical protein
MAKISRLLRYSIPDVLYSTENTLGKTSTQLYEGPDQLVLWIDKETGRIMQSFEVENEPDRPLPLDLKREILYADTEENCIKIALIYGGLEDPKIYEVAVGPEDQANAQLVDPSDIRTVYNREPVDADYKAPLQFMVYVRDRTDEFIRRERNARLAKSDGKIAPDMPEEMKQKWLDYRQKLRDLPADWADVPNFLIQFPRDPEDDWVPFSNPHVKVIRIHERTADDNDALSNLPPGVR